MTLTRAEADQIAREAREQGWEGDHRIIKLDGQEYDEGYGRVTIYDWDEINRARKEIGNESLGGRGCSVELHWPNLMGPEYWITERDDWRKLKAKVEEMKEITQQVVQRGWQLAPFGRLQKAGKLGMMIEVIPRGGSSAYPVRVGGMRTWRKLCREYDEIIDVTPRTQIIPARD